MYFFFVIFILFNIIYQKTALRSKVERGAYRIESDEFDFIFGIFNFKNLVELVVVVLHFAFVLFYLLFSYSMRRFLNKDLKTP